MEGEERKGDLERRSGLIDENRFDKSCSGDPRVLGTGRIPQFLPVRSRITTSVPTKREMIHESRRTGV